MASHPQKPEMGQDQLLFFFADLCESLSCLEALPIRGLCRRACEAFGPVALAAAAFAVSRPYYHKGRGALGSLATWTKAWEACAQASAARGQSVCVWARCRKELHYDFGFADKLDGLVADGERCLGVLAAEATRGLGFAGLLLLSDGSFLLFQLDDTTVRRCRARTLAELAPFWYFAEDGGLRFAASTFAEAQPVGTAMLGLLASYLEFGLEDKVAAGLLMRGCPPVGAPQAAPQRTVEQSRAETSCYEEVVHWESAAEIPPEEAQAISRQIWAGHVERLAELFAAQPERSRPFTCLVARASSLGAEPSEARSHAAAPPDLEEWTCIVASPQPATELWDTVFLVGLSRVCDALRAALQKGRELEPVRAAASAAGQSWQHASGAAVFLYPEQYPRVLEALKEEQLWPHHVLIVEAFLPLLYHEIVQLPSRADVRPCSRRPHMLVHEDGSVVAAVEKTFIRAPASARRRPESVVQSLRGRREGENPRRREP